MVPDPNTAVLLIALGTLGIYWELCRPGKIAPGVIGGVGFIVGVASLMNSGARPSWLLVALLTIPLAAASTFLLRVAVRARRNKRSI